VRLTVFNVEHGACALLVSDDGRTVMIDCGHNSTSGWYPGDHLVSIGVHSLDALFNTNYDQDHVSGFPNLIDRVHVRSIFRNTSVQPATIWHLKSEDGIVSAAMTRFVQAISQQFLPPGSAPPLQIPGVSVGLFHNSYPHFEDENNLSMVVALGFSGVNFLFPGDLETDGWAHLLATNPQFRAEVARTNVLVASHHGRQNGVYESLFDVYGCRPQIVVISDDEYQFDTQQTVPYYRSKCSGISGFRGQGTRHVLTTRRDGDISFVTTGNGSVQVL